MTKLDLRKEMKPLYSPSDKGPELVEVPAMQFLMIDGAGNPNISKDFQDAIGALYSLAYTTKFRIKKEESVEYPVLALEALWWNDKAGTLDFDRKGDWQWTTMLMQPDIITEAAFQKTLEEIKRKGKMTAAIQKVRLEKFHEGRCAQIMHIGPYSTEKPTIEKLHRFIAKEGYEAKGKHHEIYLGDPRRAKPEKLKTILRQPVVN